MKEGKKQVSRDHRLPIERYMTGGERNKKTKTIEIGGREVDCRNVNSMWGELGGGWGDGRVDGNALTPDGKREGGGEKRGAERIEKGGRVYNSGCNAAA